MADVGIEQLKEDIQDNIKTNNSQAITGAVLQGQLIDTVDTLKGYTDDHVSVSQNTITIGGEYAGEVSTTYDVTLHSGETFESLEDLLSDEDLATLIPANVRKGGMTIKFVQTTDNKYMQARCMAQSFTTDVTQWQVVDDEPTAGSNNLVKSGGVYSEEKKIESKILYTPDTEIINYSDYYNIVYGIMVQAGKKYYVKHLSGYRGNLFTDNNDIVNLITGQWVEFIPNNTQFPRTYSSSQPEAAKVIFADAGGVYQELKRIEDAMNSADSSLATDIAKVDEKWIEKVAINNYEGESQKIINTSGQVVAGSYYTQYVSQIIDISDYDYLLLDLTCPVTANNACAFAFYDDDINTSTGAGLISIIQYPDIINNNLKITKPEGATKVIIGYLLNVGAGWFGIKNFFGGVAQDADGIIAKIDKNQVATNKVSLSNYSLGTGYLDRTGKLQTSQYCNRFITNPIAPTPIRISISGDRNYPMILFYDDNIDFSTGAGFISSISFGTDINENVLITADMIPANATKMVFNGIYQTPTYFGVEANFIETLDNNALYQALKDKADQVAIYLSPNGSDINDGKTPSTPRLSIQKAIDEGYKNIVLAGGEYKNQQIELNNIDGLSIICDADATELNLFESHGRRSHAKIDNSIDVELTAYSGNLYRAELSVGTSHSYYKVFISEELPIIYSGGGYYGQTPTYNAILWEITKDILTCKKLVPVLTTTECENTAGTFTYDGTYLYVHPYDSTITDKTYKRLNLDGQQKLVSLTNCKNIFVQGVDICFAPYIDLYTYRLSKTTFRDCVFSFTCYGATCEIVNSDISFYSCTATHAANDGWGIAGYGNCSLYNCNGIHCYDDGVSHHDAATGCIDGGEWCYNAKGGITPSYGSKVNVQNVVSHHNPYGLYYVAEAGRETDAKLLLQNSLMYENTVKDLKVTKYNVISHGCQYGSRQIDSDATLLEFGNTIINI